MKILILITLMALYGCTTINKVTGCEAHIVTGKQIGRASCRERV